MKVSLDLSIIAAIIAAILGFSFGGLAEYFKLSSQYQQEQQAVAHHHAASVTP